MELISATNLQSELNDFINSSEIRYFVNSIAGTGIINMIIDAIKTRYDSKQVIFVNGVQDDKYITGEVFENNVYYADLFEMIYVDGIEAYDMYKPMFANEEPEHINAINSSKINRFEVMVIVNAHMIEEDYLNTLKFAFKGKMICIADPFDIFGEQWGLYPTFVEPVTKLPDNISYARFLYGFESYGTEKKLKRNIKYNIKIARRSVGKIDPNQYITSDPNFAVEIREKQYSAKPRKNQKIIVIDDSLYQYPEPDNLKIIHSLHKGTLLRLESVGEQSIIVRFHMSKKLINGAKFSYIIKPFLTPADVMHVAPANILLLPEAMKHRFKYAIMVTTPEYPTLSIREQYTLLKMCDNITFTYVK